MSSWLPAAGPVPRRGSSWLVAACVLIAVVGGLGAAAGFGSMHHGQPVLVLARPVLQGQVIQDADLGIGEVDVPGAPVVPAAEREKVVGTRAMTTLVAGELLAPDGFGDPGVLPGMSQVTLRLAPSQLPSSPLPGGRKVWLLGVTRVKDEAPVAQFEATVVYPPEARPGGDVIMDVAVAAGDVAGLAPFLLNGNVTLVVADG